MDLRPPLRYLARQSLGESATPEWLRKAALAKRVHAEGLSALRRSLDAWKRYSPTTSASRVTSEWMRAATAAVTVVREGPKMAAAERESIVRGE